MTDAKITELDDLPTPAGADLFAMVDDVVGTATTKKATLANVEAVIDHTNIVAGDGSDHADVVVNTNISTSLQAASGAWNTAATNTTNLMTASAAWNTDVASGAAHFFDASDPHTANLVQTQMDLTSGAIIGDNVASGAGLIRNVCIGVEPTAGPATNYPQGTIYVQYTA